MVERAYLTILQASTYTGYDRETIREWITRGY